MAALRNDKINYPSDQPIPDDKQVQSHLKTLRKAELLRDVGSTSVTEYAQLIQYCDSKRYNPSSTKLDDALVVDYYIEPVH